MDYGHFDDSTREYVITRPDTPLPWLNYLGQENFFGLCTNTGGGYSFWKDAKLRRLTRYRYNSVPLDEGGRCLYVNDGGCVWNPGWRPAKTPLDSYECRVGLGYEKISGRKNGLEVEVNFFVPPGRDEEVWRVRVTNRSGQRKTPKIFSLVEFCFYEALNDMTNYQRTWSIGEVEVEGGPLSGCAASGAIGGGPSRGAGAAGALASVPGTAKSFNAGARGQGRPAVMRAGPAPAGSEGRASAGAGSGPAAAGRSAASAELKTPPAPLPCAVYHKTEYRERRSHYTLFGCTAPTSGFDTDRDAFLGAYNGLGEAAVPRAGASRNSIAFGWNPVGSHEVDLDLAPGASYEYAYVLAYVEQDPEHKFEEPGIIDKTKGRQIMARYADIGAVDAALASLGVFWNGLLSKFQADLPDADANRMLNVWNQYQCMATFNLSRAASLYETGIGRGMGFRDSNQDILGFVHMIPDRARERILDIAGTQLSDGTCFHQYQPLTKKGNAEIGGGFYDDHLWLILSACAYIKETGDLGILDEPVGYADGKYITGTDGIKRHACGGRDTYAGPAGADGADSRPGGGAPAESLLDHLELSLSYTMKKRGPHGLPLIGHADWNDCLNLNCFSKEPNESFQCAGDAGASQAESLMIAGLFLCASDEMAALYSFMGQRGKADAARAAHAEMLAAVESAGWDGEWYRRAYDAAGRPVGSKSCEEGKIFIESQAWCVLGGAGSDSAAGAARGRARTALESLNSYLFTPRGIILQQPAYSRYHLELGEISSYPEGVKENAGIFCHNNAWIHLALCRLGMGDRALEYYRSICPSVKQSEIDVYRSEPYVYAQMIAGPDAPCYGEAKNSWLTGTAAWTFVALSQGILGIQPEYEGLRVDPCISRSWKKFSVTRTFRGAVYTIEVRNPKGVQKGVAGVRIDGKAVKTARAEGAASDSALLPVFPAGTEHRVEIELG